LNSPSGPTGRAVPDRCDIHYSVGLIDTEAGADVERRVGDALGEGGAAPRGFSAVADTRHLVRLGGIPTLTFGPGDIHNCHGPDEALPVAELRRALTWTALFLARYYGAA